MSGRHASDCAVHSEPAYPAGPCDCHLSIESRLDEMIKHAYQGSTDAADEIRQELVERYKAMQPADEPVGEVLNERGEVDYISYVPPAGTPLYTRPQPAAWVGLTDDELRDAIKTVDGYEQYIHPALRQLSRAIEAKLKEKNGGGK